MLEGNLTNILMYLNLNLIQEGYESVVQISTGGGGLNSLNMVSGRVKV